MSDSAKGGSATASGRTLAAWVCFFLGGCFLLLAAQEGCYQSAEKIRGVVIEKGYTAGTSGAGRRSSGTKSSHWVRYRFTTAEGETKEHVDGEVLPGTWRELREGGPVDVEYMPSIADSRVAGQKAAGSTYAAIGVALLVVGALARRSARRAQGSAAAPS